MGKIYIVQAKNILEFLNKQEGTSKLVPHMVYELCKKILIDVRTYYKEHTSSSNDIERLKIE